MSDLISRSSALKPYEGLRDDDVISVALIRANLLEEDDAISKGATNGDMIKSMFPNIRLSYNSLGDRAIFDGDHYIASTDWWDAPYKAESEG